MNSRMLVAALVCGLVSLPASSPAQEKQPTKKSGLRRVMSGLTWAKMELPDPLKNETAVFQRRRIRTRGRPVEFAPYRLSDLKPSVTWSQMQISKPRHMNLPASLDSDAVVLEGRRESTSPAPEFLPYHVGELRQGLSWDEMFQLFNATVEAPTYPHSFSLVLAENDVSMWRVGCRWKRAASKWTDQPDPVSPMESQTIQCQLTSIASDQKWTLDLETSALADLQDAPPHGRLSDGKRGFEVRRSYAEDRNLLKLAPLTGYLFLDDQEPVAAATRDARERLIFRRSLSSNDRSLIAAVACALRVPFSDIDLDAPAQVDGFSFTLTENETEMWRVACRSEDTDGWWNSSGINNLLTGEPPVGLITVDCHLVSADGRDHRTLAMETDAWVSAEGGRFPAGGRLTGTNQVYEMTPSYVEGLMDRLPLAGYFFTLENKPVAAAATSPMGQLAIHNSVAPTERSAIAAGAVALILLTPTGVK